LYDRARLGYYGRVQYNYKEKYLAEFICRYDGSYIFPEDKRFGFFPGVLLGWNITNESFFNVEPINYLKLRASYGQMGNDQVAYDVDGDGDPDLQEYAFLNSYVLGTYPINYGLANTLGEVVLANPDFTWEVANNYNIGLDASLFRNKIDLTLEYFFNKRDKILIQKLGSTPRSTGFFTTDIAGVDHSLLPPVNNGRVDNKGFEFSLAYKGKIGRDITFRAGINGGYAKNEVVYIDETPGIPDYQKQEGKPINAYLVYESDGAFLNEDEIAKNTIDYSGVTPQLIPGDMKFKDVNNDGIINGDDQVRQDKSITPPWNYGATFEMHYKGFDFSFLFQGAAGAEIRIQTESGDIGNYLQHFYEHRWSIDNPSSTDPRLAIRGDTYYTGGPYGQNTYYLFSKNYIRLKNIELAYNIPSSFLKKYNISNIRLFVNGLNVFTIDKSKIFDPEATITEGTYYPQPRVINSGLSITF
jgi:TonB-linked SusC/RagA family outer membrane protein